jgi:8-oxo-dGTP pyrophosphatase MutT (NUDIX family)
VHAKKDQPSGQNKPQKSRPRRPADRLRTVHETSAGGLVIDGIDGPKEGQVAALIGRIDRRGRMLWSLPKGHIELGETAEQTAIREVAEETGIQGSVLAASAASTTGSSPRASRAQDRAPLLDAVPRRRAF